MSTMDIIYLIYAFIGVLCIRPVAGHIAWSISNNYSQKKPDSADWACGAFFGAVIGVLWPLALTGVLSMVVVNKISPAIGAEKQAHLKAEIEARKKRDDELGLEPYEYGKVTS